jgi:N-acyl-D-aspartate/D-glutamate deacylase
MPHFELLIRGGTLVDGSGAPARQADVALRDGRIEAVGDLSALARSSVAQVLEAAGLVVCPGFIDLHGHSDASALVDGQLLSLLAQGITTHISGNCGEGLAPVTPAGRELLGLGLAGARALEPAWSDVRGYLERVEALDLGPNVGFLIGHGTVRASVLGAVPRAPEARELATMVRAIEEGLENGAFGVSSGLIYAPGVHAAYDELAACVEPAARRGALYATHIRNESGGLFEGLAEAVAVAWGEGVPARLQVSHLKAGAQVVWGQGPEALHFLDEARRMGLDVTADQYPYTAAATSLATILSPELLALAPQAAVRALREPAVRAELATAIATRTDGWENVAGDPGWAAIRLTDAARHREWQGRSFSELGEELGRAPLEVACDLLADEDLEVGIAVECMAEPDVEAILASDQVAVCTDAAGLRPGHPILGAGRVHPRAYGSFPRVLGRYVRERGVLPLERAVHKMTALPAGCIGLRRRGQVREGWAADLVVFDPLVVADCATESSPHTLPAGIAAVIVNGTLALEDGRETGARAGRLLRRGES